MSKLFDFLIPWVIVQAFMLLADWRANQPEQSAWFRPDWNRCLGAEHDEIAQAILAGRGFSDPFRTRTGPTAWMPPFLPYFQAGLYQLTANDRDSVVLIILDLKSLVLAFTGFLLLQESRKLSLWRASIVVLALTFFIYFYHFFQMTHDIWLVLMLMNCVWWGHVKMRCVNSWIWVGAWGMFGGFVALCSPVVAFVWAALTTARYISMIKRTERRIARDIKPLVLAAAASILVVAPWTIRTRLVMGKWVPIKSNGSYEVWQSLCQDADGVLEGNTLRSFHPWPTNGPERKRYARLGEIGFLAEKRTESLNAIVNDPRDVARRVLRRFAAATVFFYPHFSEYATTQPVRVSLTRALFPIPFASWLFLLVSIRRKPPVAPGLRTAVAIYPIYLAPYIAISFYDRYLAPLAGIQMLLIMYSMAAVRERIQSNGAQASSEDETSAASGTPLDHRPRQSG